MRHLVTGTIVLLVLCMSASAQEPSRYMGGPVELAEGDLQGTVDVFAMFDTFKPTKNFTIPPLED